MLTTGTTPLATTNDNPITLLSVDSIDRYRQLFLINESAVPGFFSINAGKSWCRYPDGAKAVTIDVDINRDVLFKRVAGGANVTGIYAWLV